MPAPNFDAKEYHEIVCGVPGVSFEQNGCYYNIRGEYVKPSGRRKVEVIAANMPGIVNKPGARRPLLSAAAVPETVVDASRENEKAARAEQAAS